MTEFSQNLKERTIKYFAEEYDHHINEETANEYLESMAGLYAAFAKEPSEGQATVSH